MHLCVQIYYQGIVQQLRWNRANLTSNNPNLYLIDTLISKRMNVFNTNEWNVTIDWEDISYWYRRINFANGNFISAIIFWWNKSTLSSFSSFCVTLEKKNDTRQALKDLMERTYIKFVQKNTTTRKFDVLHFHKFIFRLESIYCISQRIFLILI